MAPSLPSGSALLAVSATAESCRQAPAPPPLSQWRHGRGSLGFKTIYCVVRAARWLRQRSVVPSSPINCARVTRWPRLWMSLQLAALQLSAFPNPPLRQWKHGRGHRFFPIYPHCIHTGSGSAQRCSSHTLCARVGTRAWTAPASTAPARSLRVCGNTDGARQGTFAQNPPVGGNQHWQRQRAVASPSCFGIRVEGLSSNPRQPLPRAPPPSPL